MLVHHDRAGFETSRRLDRRGCSSSPSSVVCCAAPSRARGVRMLASCAALHSPHCFSIPMFCITLQVSSCWSYLWARRIICLGRVRASCKAYTSSCSTFASSRS